MRTESGWMKSDPFTPCVVVEPGKNANEIQTPESLHKIPNSVGL